MPKYTKQNKGQTHKYWHKRKQTESMKNKQDKIYQDGVDPATKDESEQPPWIMPRV